MIKNINGKYCVIHGHAQKSGSKIDKPKGSVIKCFDTLEEARKMHRAIVISQKTQSFHKSILCFRDLKLTQNEILNKIDNNDMQRIKQNNPHPFFRAYDLAMEGEFSPKVLGEENIKSIKWTRKAIQSIKNVALKGIKFFKGHNEDNSTDDRESFGEVVANYETETEIDNKTHHIIIGYFPDKSLVVNDDIISMEAEWSFFDYAGKWIADKLSSVTGIALGATKNGEQPAFSGARLLGEVQALEKGIKMSDEKKLNFYDLQKSVKEMNVFPHQIFTLDQLKEDREFGKHFIEFETKEKKFVEDIKVLETRAKTAEDKIKSIETDYNKTTAKTRMDNYLKTNNIILTPKEKNFIDVEFNDLSDLTDESIQKFVPKARDKFKTLAQQGIFGEIKKEEIQVTSGGDKKIDLEKPEFNDCITPD
jgi:hypothetical protein